MKQIRAHLATDADAREERAALLARRDDLEGAGVDLTHERFVDRGAAAAER